MIPGQLVDSPPLPGGLVRSALPHDVVRACAAAVDPLEVAAILESAGVSRAVARQTFGRNDVFELADELYGDLPFTWVAHRREREWPQFGAMSDIGRGLLYILPSITFAAANKALHLRLSWWVLPVALMIGWAAGQGTASVCFQYLLRKEEPGLLVAWSVLVSLAVAAGFGATVQALVGGGRWSAAVILVVAFSLTTFAVLLAFHDELILFLTFLVPTSLSAVFLLHTSSLSGIPALRGTWIVASTAAAMAAMLTVTAWHAFRPRSRSQRVFLDYDVVRKHVLNGFCSGFAAAAIFELSGRSGHHHDGILASFPVMVTLGVLEWQTRSFRARVTQGLSTTVTTRQFRSLVMRSLLRSLAIYAVAAASAGGILILVAVKSGGRISLLVLAADVILGLSFLLGLILASCVHVDRAVRAWGWGLGVTLGLFVVDRVAHATFTVSEVAELAILSLTITFGVLLFSGLRSLTAPCQYA